jgi:Fe-S-cluster-containing dehydrogenase component
MMSKQKINRRDFLKVTGAGLTVIAGNQVLRQKEAKASGPTESSAHQWGMVIDQDTCIGCGYCTLACRATNDVPPDISWNIVLDAGQVGEKNVYLPRPCLHCVDAPCVDVCPVEATYHRSDGVVVIDYDRCIGCRYCEVACPYGARSFNWKDFDGANPLVPEWGEPEVPRRPRGVVEKCTFCSQRIERGLSLGLTPGTDADATPACAVVCPVGARLFGDLNDSESLVSQSIKSHASYRLREDLGTDPRVYYLPAEHEDQETPS